jgi:hypothetical protein
MLPLAKSMTRVNNSIVLLKDAYGGRSKWLKMACKTRRPYRWTKTRRWYPAIRTCSALALWVSPPIFTPLIRKCKSPSALHYCSSRDIQTL